MKWRRWMMVSGLVVGLAVAGCGDDPQPIDTNQNQTDNDDGQNDPNQINQVDDEFAEDVDVWVGDEVTGEAEPPTSVLDDQTFGGRFDDDGGVHRFGVAADAGQALTISGLDYESGLEEELDQLEIAVYPESPDQDAEPPRRTFDPSVHDEREFLVYQTANHVVEVQAPGGEDYGYHLSFDTAQPEADQDLEIPGTTEGDLDDGTIDVYDATSDEAQAVELELFAGRAPVSSDLDAWVFIWDAEAGELAGAGLAQTEDNPDPFVPFDVPADTDYHVIVDMDRNVADAGYELQAELLETSSNNPQVLSLDDVDSFSGTIREWQTEPHYDYFAVTVEPGEYKRVHAVGDDELEPFLELDEQTEDDGGFFDFAAAEAFAVDGESGATLGVGEEADGSVTFTIDLTDQRNVLEDELEVYYGGDDFGYTISLEDADPEVLDVESGDEETVSLDEPGELALLDIDVDEDHVLWLDGGQEPEDDVENVWEADFVPSWAMADFWTLDGTQSFHGFQWTDQDSYEMLVRDALFRGDEYETDIRVNAFDATAPDYQQTDLSDGNESFDQAVSPDLPASIVGDFENEDAENPEVFYFEVELEADETVVAHTYNDPVTEADLTVLDDDEEVAAVGNLYFDQRQEPADEDEEFYDSAVAYRADEQGTYVLAVEQWCSPLFGACDTGGIDVQVFVE